MRLILGPDVIVIWRENLLHSGTKSRKKGKTHTTRQANEISHSRSCDKETTVLRSNIMKNHSVKEDLRFFAYVTPTHKKGMPRSKQRAQTSDGSRIYRLTNNICENFNELDRCKDCKEGAAILDLTTITGYQMGQTIIGNLD